MNEASVAQEHKRVIVNATVAMAMVVGSVFIHGIEIYNIFISSLW